MSKTTTPSATHILQTGRQNGSILLYILLGIVLLGMLTVALRNVGTGTGNIDREDMILKAGNIQRYGQEMASAVADLLSSGLSETDIRFAHPDAPLDYGTITIDPTHQVFGKSGAKLTYQTPPDGINDGSPWEFFATTRIPQVGSDRAELVAVLPHVTQEFCQMIDRQLGFSSGTQPTDSTTGTTPDCVAGASSQRFTGGFNDISPNEMDATSFSRLPSLQACVYCAADSTYNYYYVLLAR